MFDRHHPENEEKQCRLETGQKIAPEATQIRSSIRFLILSLPYADRLERDKDPVHKPSVGESKALKRRVGEKFHFRF
jgi:hypothetical protein